MQCLAWSPDGQTLAAAGDDRRVHILYSIAVNPAGTLVATGSRDGTYKLWSLDGKLLTTQKADTDQVIFVAFSPDGQTLATLGYGGNLVLWQLDCFDDGLLERLVRRGLNWCKDYLQTNPTGKTLGLCTD